MDYMVIGHLPPPVTGENLCRARLVEVLKEYGCHIADLTRKNIGSIFFGKQKQVIIVNGQSLAGTLFDLSATFWSLLRGRHVYWYFHNRSWKRFASIPSWLWLGMAKRIHAVTLRTPYTEAFRKAGYRSTVLNNRVESFFEQSIISLPPTPPKRLIWMGRPEEVKGFPLALEVFNQLRQSDPEWIFDVYGADAQFAKAHQLESKGATYHGFISGEAKVHAFCKGGIFILPSAYKNETQPVAIIESMACGIPTLASDIGGIPEMLHKDKHSAGISVAPQNPAEYLTKAHILIANYARYSDSSKYIYDKYFSLSAFKGKIPDIFPLE